MIAERRKEQAAGKRSARREYLRSNNVRRKVGKARAQLKSRIVSSSFRAQKFSSEFGDRRKRGLIFYPELSSAFVCSTTKPSLTAVHVVPLFWIGSKPTGSEPLPMQLGCGEEVRGFTEP